MKDYAFLEPAQIELEEEVKYYNEQQAELGYDFAKEVADTIARILRYPEAWTKLSKRTCWLPRHPKLETVLTPPGAWRAVGARCRL